jgi:hypothetical protein
VSEVGTATTIGGVALGSADLDVLRRWSATFYRAYWVAPFVPGPRVGFGVIYELVDPRTFKVRYVGQTADMPWRRLRNHRHCPDRYMRRWVTELRNAGLAPQMRVVEWCPRQHLLRREAAWIRTRRAEGADLINCA